MLNHRCDQISTASDGYLCSVCKLALALRALPRILGPLLVFASPAGSVLVQPVRVSVGSVLSGVNLLLGSVAKLRVNPVYMALCSNKVYKGLCLLVETVAETAQAC